MSIAALSRFVLRHKALVVCAWVVITLAGLVATGPASEALSTRFDLPGRESTEVSTAIVERYGNGGFAPPFVAVVTLPEGTTVDTPGVVAELEAIFARVAAAAPATRVVSYASTGDRAFVSPDGRTTFGLIYPRYTGDGPSPDEAVVVAALAGATVAAAEVALTGLAEEVEGSDDGGGGVLVETLVGAGGALLVLLWVFGSVLAVLPLVIAAASILTCFLLVWGLTGLTDVSVIIQYLIALIGLGVAIDYSLLVVTRWREERAAGYANATAVQRAMETAGHAVIFSGTTVATGLLALIVLPVPFLRSIGFGGMLIPLVSSAVTLTLLPVILATLGPRLDWPRLRRGDQSSHLWGRWAAFLVRHRGPAAMAGLLLLGLLLLPAVNLKLASPVSSAFADDAATAALERAGIPAGAVTPFEVLVEAGDPAAVAARLAGVEGVITALAPAGDEWRRDGTALLLVLPQADGSSGEGRATLAGLREAARVTAQGRVGLIFRPSPGPVPALVDGERIRQIMTILLDNALKHTPEGGTISVEVRSTPGGVELAVADTGGGIAAEHLPHIFDRFYRVDEARGKGGAGLGLAIARQIAEQHGGTLDVSSAPGRGATFTLHLPREATASAADA